MATVFGFDTRSNYPAAPDEASLVADLEKRVKAALTAVKVATDDLDDRVSTIEDA